MKTVIKNVWSNEFYQGGIVLISGSVIINILNYLFNFLAARSLGPSGYGEVTALLSYIAITSLPFAILSTIIIQKISAAGVNRTTYAASLEQLFIEKAKKLLLLFSPLLIFIPFLTQLTNLSSISSYCLVPLIILSFLISFYNAANQGLRLFFLAMIIATGTTALKFLGALLTYFHIDGITTIIFFLFISALFSLVLSYLLFHKKTKQNYTKIRKIEKTVFSILLSKQFLIFTLSVTGISLFGTIDIIFIKKFFSPEMAGIYSSWSLFSKIIFYAVNPLISLSFIFFSSTETKNQQKRTLIVSLIFLLFIGLASYFVYTNFAHMLVAIFFGDRFNPVTQYLGKASIFGSLYTAMIFINNYFLSKKNLAALILPLGLPIYVATLFMIPKEIDQIMQLTIMFSFFIIFLYLLYFFQHYLKIKTK